MSLIIQMFQQACAYTVKLQLNFTNENIYIAPEPIKMTKSINLTNPYNSFYLFLNARNNESQAYYQELELDNTKYIKTPIYQQITHHYLRPQN